MKNVVVMGHNYSRPFFYRGVEWTILDSKMSDEETRKYIDEYLKFSQFEIQGNKDAISFLIRR